MHRVRQSSDRMKALADAAETYAWFGPLTNVPSCVPLPSLPSLKVLEDPKGSLSETLRSNTQLTREERSYLVYHTNRALNLSGLLAQFNAHFKVNYSIQQIQRFFRSCDCMSFEDSQEDASKYGWSVGLSPVDEFLYCNLSTRYMTLEHRAYLWFFHGYRGQPLHNLMEVCEQKFNSDAHIHYVKSDVVLLGHNHHIAQELLRMARKFDWWEPEPLPNEEAWAHIQKHKGKEGARARMRAAKVQARNQMKCLKLEEVQ